MATPLGHSLIGVALARRLGITSPAGMVLAVIAASLPDADVVLSYALHRDPWKLHRTFTHQPGFAISAGLLLGACALAVDGGTEDRDLVADGLRGVALVGSHVVLDRVNLPYPPLKPGRTPGIGAYVMDLVFYGALAALIWPRRRAG